MPYPWIYIATFVFPVINRCVRNYKQVLRLMRLGTCLIACIATCILLTGLQIVYVWSTYMTPTYIHSSLETVIYTVKCSDIPEQPVWVSDTLSRVKPNPNIFMKLVSLVSCPINSIRAIADCNTIWVEMISKAAWLYLNGAWEWEIWRVAKYTVTTLHVWKLATP